MQAAVVDRRALLDGSAVMDLLPAGAAVYAASGEILYYNAAASNLWGQRPERFDPLIRFSGAHRLLRRDGSTLAPEDTAVAISLRTGQFLESFELLLERPDGGRLRVASNVRPVDDELGIRLGAIEVFQERSGGRVERLRDTDELTRALQHPHVDVAELAHDVAARLADRAQAVDSEIRVDAPTPVHAVADRQRLDDVLTFLVGDALRHARGRRVDVRVLRGDASVEIGISIHGLAATFTTSLPLAPST